MNAYSRLKHILRRQQLSIPELHRRLRKHGFEINIKSLYRLNDDNQPVERLDMRVAGAICQVCTVPLTDWIVFEEDHVRLHTLTESKQARLDALMDQNNEGQLTTAERTELQQLVREAEEIMLTNARLLAAQHKRLASARPKAVDNAA